ncbi:MAG: hypothetical protein ACRD0G_17960 [Acidimicrobiales bacterium]
MLTSDGLWRRAAQQRVATDELFALRLRRLRLFGPPAPAIGALLVVLGLSGRVGSRRFGGSGVETVGRLRTSRQRLGHWSGGQVVRRGGRLNGLAAF